MSLRVELVAEMARRLTTTEGWLGANTVETLLAAGDEASYCLDAPALIPAGSARNRCEDGRITYIGATNVRRE